MISKHSLIRQLISPYDFIDFIYHRSKMKFIFFLNRVKKRLYLGKDINSILIVRIASMGDVVRSTAVIELLRAKYPNAKLDYLTSSLNLAVLKNNPHLHKIYTPKDFNDLKAYDWIIVLQSPDPPKGFLQDGAQFVEILDFLSNKIQHKLITGRHFKRGREIRHTTAFYCHTEIEELFQIALLDYDLYEYPKTKIYLGEKRQREVNEKFALISPCNYLGIFLGGPTQGAYDKGAKTYSMAYLEQLVEQSYGKFTIVFFGQSVVKTSEDNKYFQEMVKKYPKIINLVDQTTLEELVYVMNTFSLLISCDSGPLHIAMAVQVPVIGLFLNCAGFRVCPKLVADNYILINSLKPCFKYSWRWKFDFSPNPADTHNYCDTGSANVKHKIDLIPVQRLVDGMDIRRSSATPISV
jgi:ADP-heptose:LPS heptosyltransferase